MSFLLDRDTCEAWVRRVPLVRNHFSQHSGLLHVSAVTMMGIGLWLLHPRTPVRHLQGYTALMQEVKVVSVDEPIAYRAARLGNLLRSPRPLMGPVDLLVASTTLEQGMILVTHDVQYFRVVPGLAMVDWMVP